MCSFEIIIVFFFFFFNFLLFLQYFFLCFHFLPPLQQSNDLCGKFDIYSFGGKKLKINKTEEADKLQPYKFLQKQMMNEGY